MAVTVPWAELDVVPFHAPALRQGRVTVHRQLSVTINRAVTYYTCHLQIHLQENLLTVVHQCQWAWALKFRTVVLVVVVIIIRL